MFMEVGSVKPNGHLGISYSKEDSGCANKEMGREGREVISHWSLRARERKNSEAIGVTKLSGSRLVEGEESICYFHTRLV